jgi:hypothetical protein
MVTFKWAPPALMARTLLRSMTNLNDNPWFSYTEALKTLLAYLVALTYALYILAYPPRYRKLSILLLAIPTGYAFVHSESLTPNSTLSDTFGRFTYIWLAHMSYIVTIQEFSPPTIKENINWRSRLSSAYKVLFARNSRTHTHNYMRRAFLLHHVWKMSYMYLLQSIWHIFTTYYVRTSPINGAEYANFFRRLPASLDADELWDRFDHVMYWCIINKLIYDTYHSLFALFFVGLGFDSPSEWSLTLFGPYSDAWSVRRYWGKHWHDFIYRSFSEHTKIVTRKWLRMRPRTPLTRIVENTIVFGMSGVAHSAVRYIQDPESGDCWAITFWYLGQMVPIVIEDVVQNIWKQKKKELGIPQSKWLDWADRVLGYTWVIAFNAWSIPKYVHTRQDWMAQHMRKKYAKQAEEWAAKNPGWEGEKVVETAMETAIKTEL